MSQHRSRISRRKALQLAAGAGAASVAAHHGFRPVIAQDATPGSIIVPEPRVELPTEDITFRWIDSGDLKARFFTQYFHAFQQAHSNIEIQYDALPWTEINRIVPLGVQNGDAHDVFALPQEVPGSQAVGEGWVAPLDDIIPNFEEWKIRFPFGSFLNGVHVFDGKTYNFPFTSSKRYWTMTFYNTEQVQQAGYDFENKPPTWDEYREAARKITEQGQGQYFGVIFGGKSAERLAVFVRNLARMAGAPAGGSLGFNDIDWRTGEFLYTSDQYLAAIDLLIGLKDDGSIFPGSLSLSEAEARGRFPQGVAGMLLEGPWNIPQWQEENPDFTFGLVSQPVPNSGEITPLTYEETGGNIAWVYADSEYKQIAGEMFSYIGSPDGQLAMMAATRGNLRSVFQDVVEEAQESVDLDPLAGKALDMYDEQMRLGPMVTIRNPGASQVAFEARPLTPDLGQIMQGVLADQISDPKAAMQDLQDRANAELERAIKAAQDAGANVSRDDWVFANWDPGHDYTEEDYSAL
jgi:multiple sugar transport system substrate-binding protein